MKSVMAGFFSTKTEMDIQFMARSYHRLLEPYKFDDIMAGLESFLLSDTKGFPPSPGQILDSMFNVVVLANGGEETPDKAWEILYKAVSNSGRNSVEEFEKLPDSIKKIVGSSKVLQDWADDESGRFLAYKPTFERTFKENQLKDREKQKLQPIINSIQSKNVPLEKSSEPQLIEEKKEVENSVTVKQKRDHKIIRDLIAELNFLNLTKR